MIPQPTADVLSSVECKDIVICLTEKIRVRICFVSHELMLLIFDVNESKIYIA